MKKSQARKNLPRKYQEMPDEQLELLLNQLELFAEIIIDNVENSSKRQLGVIDTDKARSNNGK